MLKIRPIDPFFMLLPRSEREGEEWPTRPFYLRCSSFLRAGIGGSWGSIGVEIKRPRKKSFHI